jgi:hypothetical protein
MSKAGWLVGVPALALLVIGAALINAPVRTAGPMNIDLQLPTGALCVAAGLALLEAAPTSWKHRLFFVAALVIAVVAGRNLYFYPPIDDGAYFMLRYGREFASDWAPAAPLAHLLAFAAAVWALLRARPPTGRESKQGASAAKWPA